MPGVVPAVEVQPLQKPMNYSRAIFLSLPGLQRIFQQNPSPLLPNIHVKAVLNFSDDSFVTCLFLLFYLHLRVRAGGSVCAVVLSVCASFEHSCPCFLCTHSRLTGSQVFMRLGLAAVSDFTTATVPDFVLFCVDFQ